jgi:hypothetical protein
MNKLFPTQEIGSLPKAPWLLAFQYLGARLQKYLPYFDDLGSNMQKAGLKISLHSYVSLMAMLSAISFAAGFSATLVVALVFAIPILLTILFAFGVSTLSASLVFGVLYGLPGFLATSRRRRMDLELAYVDFSCSRDAPCTDVQALGRFSYDTRSCFRS